VKGLCHLCRRVLLYLCGVFIAHPFGITMRHPREGGDPGFLGKKARLFVCLECVGVGWSGLAASKLLRGPRTAESLRAGRKIGVARAATIQPTMPGSVRQSRRPVRTNPPRHGTARCHCCGIALRHPREGGGSRHFEDRSSFSFSWNEEARICVKLELQSMVPLKLRELSR